VYIHVTSDGNNDRLEAYSFLAVAGELAASCDMRCSNL